MESGWGRDNTNTVYLYVNLLDVDKEFQQEVTFHHMVDIEIITEACTPHSKEGRDFLKARDYTALHELALKEKKAGAKGISLIWSKDGGGAEVLAACCVGLPLFLMDWPLELLAQQRSELGFEPIVNCLLLNSSEETVLSTLKAVRESDAGLVISTTGPGVAELGIEARMAILRDLIDRLVAEGIDLERLIIDHFSCSLWRVDNAFLDLLNLLEATQKEFPGIQTLTAFNNLLKGSKVGPHRAVLAKTAMAVLGSKGLNKVLYRAIGGSGDLPPDQRQLAESVLNDRSYGALCQLAEGKSDMNQFESFDKVAEEEDMAQAFVGLSLSSQVT